MKPFKHYILLLILLLPALAACSAQPAAATLTPTPGFQRGGGGTRQAGS